MGVLTAVEVKLCQPLSIPGSTLSRLTSRRCLAMMALPMHVKFLSSLTVGVANLPKLVVNAVQSGPLNTELP
jgi:hypothetical protein